MILEVKDAVVVAVATRTADRTPGVVRLHATTWLPGPLARGRGQGVEVARQSERVNVSLRLVLDRDRPVLEVVRAVQRSVVTELRRLTGLEADVSVTVVDLD